MTDRADEMPKRVRVALVDGLFPCLTTEELEALMYGIEQNDDALIQGATCRPEPLVGLYQDRCEAGCLLVYPKWRGTDDADYRLGDAAQWFAECGRWITSNIDDNFGDSVLTVWRDETPRALAFELVHREVVAELNRRERAAA